MTLVPVSLGALQPFVFVTSRSDRRATAWPNCCDQARAKPDVLNFASAGIGSSNHLLEREVLMAATGTKFVHVPYKGSISARDAVISGDAQLMDEVLAPLLAQIRSGQLRAADGDQRRA